MYDWEMTSVVLNLLEFNFYQLEFNFKPIAADSYPLEYCFQGI